MEVGLYFDQLIAGVARGALLFLVASGLTLILGVLHVLNFAHGALYLFGAYISYVIASQLIHSTNGFWLALLVAPLATAALGVLIEVVFLRRIYHRPILQQMFILFGVVYILSDVIKLIWGLGYKSVSRPEIIASSVSILGRNIPVYSLFAILLAALVALGLWFILHRTKFGRTVRAVYKDREMTAALGVNTSLLYTAVFGIGSFLAGLGGVILSGLGAFGPGMESDALILAFVVVCVGGMGSVAGAVIGALIIGIVESYGVLVLPSFSIALIYIVMVVVLIFRPAGLLGRQS